MASLNEITIIGRLGKDPEVKMTPTGQKVASFSVATSEKYDDKQGNKVEETEWHNVVAWRRLAEIIEQYVKKGSLIYIKGKIKTRSWEDQQGKKCYRTEIIAQSMQMLDSRGANNQSQGDSNFGNSAPAENFGTMPADEDLPY